MMMMRTIRAVRVTLRERKTARESGERGAFLHLETGTEPHGGRRPGGASRAQRIYIIRMRIYFGSLSLSLERRCSPISPSCGRTSPLATRRARRVPQRHVPKDIRHEPLRAGVVERAETDYRARADLSRLDSRRPGLPGCRSPLFAAASRPAPARSKEIARTRSRRVPRER